MSGKQDKIMRRKYDQYFRRELYRLYESPFLQRANVSFRLFLKIRGKRSKAMKEILDVPLESSIKIIEREDGIFYVEAYRRTIAQFSYRGHAIIFSEGYHAAAKRMGMK